MSDAPADGAVIGTAAEPAVATEPSAAGTPGDVAGVPRVAIGGVRISALTFDGAVRLFLDAPANGSRIRAHFCTAHTIVEANDAPPLMAALNGADVVAPDGMPLVWVARLRGRTIERVCGPDLMEAVVDRGRESGLRHYLYGGAEGVAETMAARLIGRYPGLQIAGTDSPPFRALSDEEREEAVRRINASGADYVWVGLGTPKQDYWLAEYRDRLDAGVLFAVGAAFDFHSGTRRRAPQIMQRTGTEWLFRLFSEPGRLWRRYTVANARFVGLVLRDLATGRRLRRQA